MFIESPVNLKNKDLFVFGLPRSGNTYFSENLKLAFPDKKFFSHLHNFDNIHNIDSDSNIAVLIRKPKEVIESWALSIYANFHFINKKNNEIDEKNYIISRLISSREYVSAIKTEKFERTNKLIIKFDDLIRDVNAVNDSLYKKFDILGKPSYVNPDMVIDRVIGIDTFSTERKNIEYFRHFPHVEKARPDVLERILQEDQVVKTIDILNEFYEYLEGMAERE